MPDVRPHTATVDGRGGDGSRLLAERVRAACVDSALHAYEEAGIRGLCVEGRWEAAVAAIQHQRTSSCR